MDKKLKKRMLSILLRTIKLNKAVDSQLVVFATDLIFLESGFEMYYYSRKKNN